RWHRVYARTAYFGFRLALITSAFFAISSPLALLEGEAQVPQQRPALVVGVGGGDHGDVHAPDRVDPVLVDLVEHRLLGEAEGVVASPVELARVQPAEVPDPRQRDRQQPVQELPHPVAAPGDLGADRHPRPELELGDGLLRPADLRLLAGDGGQVADRAIDHLGVPGGFPDSHVYHDLDQPWYLHGVAVAELLPQRGHDLLAVA